MLDFNPSPILDKDDIKRQDFPNNFLFGVATSAHQVEGAWNADGKGLSIWDCFALRNPDKIDGGANACVTVDSYSRMKAYVDPEYPEMLSWVYLCPDELTELLSSPDE
ncbi:hypothetical protein L6452_33185 [Arctium lappa]|uniref:Uncharacterized protein n=1 Tax=Arctium lappa TaxID=4217 RepID=A0ACB8Z6L0_ARCLA|nr:hypothetical protein L6452_33185 [Arctium lappa]